MDSLVAITGSYSHSVSFAMQQNYVPVIRSLILENTGEQDLEEVVLSIRVEPAFAHDFTRRIDRIPAGEKLELDDLALNISPAFLYELTEKMVGSLFITLSHGDSVLESITQTIELLAYDQWTGTQVMPELLSAFVTPNHPRIAQILAKAGQQLETWSGAPSFTAYQTRNPNAVRLQMAAIYSALQSENIAYCVPPASYGQSGQRIRLCDTLLQQKLGTCLDLTLLYAGCLEQAGLHPLLILLRQHAFAGCWQEESCFPECVQDDPSLLTKRIAEGINEIAVVECTAFVAGKSIAFDEASKAAEKALTSPGEFELCVDVKRCRGGGLRPIPLRRYKENGELCTIAEKDLRPSKAIENTDRPQELEMAGKLEHVDHIPTTRQKIWERKLLDLSLRNTLLNFRVTKSAVQLIIYQLSLLEDALSGGQEFQMMARPRDFDNSLRSNKIYEVQNQQDLLRNLTETEFANHRLRTFLDESEMAARVVGLYRAARVSMEENGVNTLYIALGFLKWYETDVSQKERYAPLVLLPIDIIRKSAQKGYVIRVRDEEPQMNITLLEMLRADFGLTISGLDPLPMDESGVDLKRVFHIMRQAVMNFPHWDVEEMAFVGLFSFSQFIMWNDIRNRSEELKRSPVVASLLSGKMEWVPDSDFPAPNRLDEEFTPADVALPISADSSQLSAICAAGRGNSFVLHGPPGTGKSQTITNMIANALFQGKSVLFIAEKMAALSVVQKRLASIGLAPFCLELHSNRAKKKDVLEQLDAALCVGRQASPENYVQQARRLGEARRELNDFVRELHAVRPYGLTLYDAISRYEQLRDASDALGVPAAYINDLTDERRLRFLDLLEQLRVTVSACKGVENHPLGALQPEAYSPALKESLASMISAYHKVLAALREDLASFSQATGLEFTYTAQRIRTVDKLRAFLCKAPSIPESLLLYTGLPGLCGTVTAAASHGREAAGLRQTLEPAFEPAIFTDLDAAALLREWKVAGASWFLPKVIGQGKIRKLLRSYAADPKIYDKKRTGVYLEQLAAFRQHRQAVREQAEPFQPLFGSLWRPDGTADDWNRLENVYQAAEALLELIAELHIPAPAARQALIQHAVLQTAEFRARHTAMFTSLEKHVEEWEQIERALSETGCIDFAALQETEADWFMQGERLTKQWETHLEDLRDYCSYLSVRRRLCTEGMAEIPSSLEQGILDAGTVVTAAQKALYRACILWTVEREPLLSGFNGMVFEQRIAHYKELAAQFEQLSREELVARLSAKVPAVSANFAASSEMGILQKAIRSGGRMLSIRKLFDSIPTLLRRLSPCMLMSPISVAQYIDPAYPPFDLVIFDEASQLPTCEAVGAIARGKHVVVVGDPKQLPPTSFFSTNQVDEDNYEQEDLESILDDCLALSMPQEHLLWHYRSRHESLIAFSNRQYYDNELYTFPSPNDLESKVRFVSVNGYYDRGKTRQNRAEAEAVVTEILRRLRDPSLRSCSIGVVTFSAVQQNLIADLLEKAFAEEPALDEWNTAMEEPLFIKNLENVQGDERDCIFFSVGYGPDQKGNVALNFGPLNRDGGWRRLNVAVSRARQEMLVFSALQPEQIDLSRTRADGVAGLKAFLTFAKNGKGALPLKEGQRSAATDALADIVAETLQHQGYTVHTHIGCSAYQVDIGVMHPEHPERYLLGILCDGSQYRQAGTARDRNLLQVSVLGSLGWRIHRVWCLDWWENPGKEQQKIEEAIRRALEEPNTPAVPIEVPPSEEKITCGVSTVAAEFPISQPAVAPELPLYEKCALPAHGMDSEAFYDAANNRLLLSQLIQVVQKEAPISRTLLCKRVLETWGMTRMGARIDRRFEELLTSLHFPCVNTGTRLFFWNVTQNPQEYNEVRVPGQDGYRRNLEEIAPEELSVAVRVVLEQQIGLSEEDLRREVTHLLGFSRTTEAMLPALSAGLETAIQRGIARRDGDRIVLPEK